MTAPDLVAALLPVIEALDSLGVRYYVGGSVASSIHGVPRASIDADLIAELGAGHVAPLAARLSALYYLDEGRMRDAVARRLSFNVIHLATMFKIDVFVSKGRPFDLEASGRARLEALGESPDAANAMVGSPEDTLLPCYVCNRLAAFSHELPFLLDEPRDFRRSCGWSEPVPGDLPRPGLARPPPVRRRIHSLLARRLRDARDRARRPREPQLLEVAAGPAVATGAGP